MAFTKMSGDMKYVRNLKDRPNESPNAMTAEQLKAVFDQAGVDLQNFINSFISDQLEHSSAASNLGATVPSGMTGVQPKIQNILNALAAAVGVVPENAVDTAQLKNGAVKTGKIYDGAVTSAKIGIGEVKATNIEGGAVTSAKIGSGEVKATNIEGGAVSTRYEKIISTTWAGDAAPYMQEISVSGMTAEDHPIVDIMPSDTYSDAEKQLSEWGKIYRFVSGSGKITVYATEKTTQAIQIQILCVRK